MHSEVVHHAKRVWSYLSSFASTQACDAIVVCCSYDLRVMDHAVDLVERGTASKLVITGNTGNWTEHLWEKPEAEVFLEHAEARLQNVDVVLETAATSFGENITNTKKLLPDAEVVTFVTKPNAILRVSLTAQKQWPEVKAHVSAPTYEFPEEASNIVGFFGVIEEMVGDVQRILEYPKLGFQIEHELPDHLMESWNYLVHKGFTNHLIK